MPTIELLQFSPISPEAERLVEIEHNLRLPPEQLARMAISMHIDDEKYYLEQAYIQLDEAAAVMQAPPITYTREENVLYCVGWGVVLSRAERINQLQKSMDLAAVSEVYLMELLAKKKQIELGNTKVITAVASQERAVLEAQKRQAEITVSKG
ncbi:MAG TPA: hypothetical protein VF575_00520 [Candidatus Saccharimonadales bacterium]|jgi:hypothetical protein